MKENIMYNSIYELNKKYLTSKEFLSLAETRKSGTKTIYALFLLLKQAGGTMQGSEAIKCIAEQLELTDWERGVFEKSGLVRWIQIMRYYTIDCVKAGFMTKEDGKWSITDKGEVNLKYNPIEFLKNAGDGYKNWKKGQMIVDPPNGDEIDYTNDNKSWKAKIEELEDLAINSLRDYLKEKNPYEFQDIVAALLKAMGYFVPFVAPKGKDGGIDIIAYRDPLGAQIPRIKVQVKHKPEAKIPLNEIQSLLGTLKNQEEIGLFVTSGGFTSDSEKHVINAHTHIKLIDFTTFISLWKKYYDKLSDEDKNLLPLHPIYFLGSNE